MRRDANAECAAGGRRIVQRVATVAGLVKWLEKLPDEAIVYHASNHHFSKWLRARSELQARHCLCAKVQRRAVQCSRRAALHCTALHCIVHRGAFVRVLCLAPPLAAVPASRCHSL